MMKYEKKKTKLRIPGFCYKLSNMELLYIGKVYIWNNSIKNVKVNKRKVEFSNSPRSALMFYPKHLIPKNMTKLSELLETIHVKGKCIIDFIHYSTDIDIQIQSSLDIYMKTQTDPLLENDIDENDIDKFITRLLDEIVTSEIMNSDYRDFGKSLPSYVLFGTVDSETPVDFTEKQKEFFEITGCKPVLLRE